MNATATITEAQRREAWLADRRTCITGTDVAAILGLSRFSSPVQVYLDKKGLAEVQENEAMRWGKRLERPILEAYAEAQQVPITFADPFTLHRVPGFPILGASLDAVREDGAPVDAKNTRHRSGDWGEDGTDQIPVYYAAQLAVQMMVQGTDFADLAVLFSGQELAWFRVHRDMETEAMIRERVSVWWERHIVQGIPPDPDGSESSTRWLAKRFARHTDAVREATPEVLEWIRKRQEADAAEKAAKAAKTEAENLIKAYLGEAQAIPGVLTWKNNKDSVGYDYEAAWKELTTTLPASVWQDIITRHFTTKPGARVLRFAK